MKALVTILILGLSTSTCWLWFQLREANDTCSRIVVGHDTSWLYESRKVEQFIRQGSVDLAIQRMQRNRDLYVLRMNDMLPRLHEGTWQFSESQWSVDQINDALAEEASFRHTYGESTSRLSDQANAVLANHR